jgi:hypothetical protein
MRYADTTPFLGVVATALAGYAVCGAWRLAPVRWMTALAALSAAYALGAFTPLHGALYSFAPVLDKARIPVRAIHLFNFGIAVLAAYGLDRMLARPGQIPLRRFSVVLAAFGSVVVAIWMLRGQPEEGVAAGAIVALVLAALAAAWRHARIGRGTLVASVTFLMLTELYPVSTRHFSSRYDKNANKFVRTLTENKDIAARLREEPGPMRLFVHDRDMPANFGDWHGFDVVEGYMAGVSGNILWVGRHTTEAQRLYGVTHHIARKATSPDQVDLYEGASGLKIFRTPGALPRAWSVHQVETVTEERLFDARIRDQSFDPARTALVMGAPPELEPCGGDDVKLVSRAPNRIRLHAAMQCRGLVVMSELFYPGWRATIDGKPAAIIEAYGSLRSLVVEKGDHAIEFVFRPISVYGGLALTLMGAVATALLVLWRHPEKPGPGKRVSATDAHR